MTKLIFIAALCVPLALQIGGDSKDKETMPVLGLLKLNSVKESLELTPGQASKINEILSEIDKIPSKIQKEFEDMDAQQVEKKSEIRELQQKMFVEKLRELDKRVETEALLPHQFERLKQISVRGRLGSAGIEGLISSGQVASIEEMEDGKKSRLSEKILLIKKQLAEDVRKLEMEAEQKIIACLDLEAQEEVKSLIGEPFVFSKQIKPASK